MSEVPYLLRSNRLGFRRYIAADGQALGPVFADPYATKFYPAMGQQEALDRWINWNLENYDKYGFGLWALELLGTGQFIGDAGITYQSVEGQRLMEIGWHIHPDFRSSGYATEAARACLEFGFASLRAPSLCSIVDPENSASIKVASRVHKQVRQYEGKSGTMLLYFTVAPGAA
ncbi:MAG TPA: GNAT family N-acetyltransferase [Gemmatimonadaceae bacterium]|nr:GNAT family N-acetyltransferase [Gemmatimonadaceae bacterium]